MRIEQIAQTLSLSAAISATNPLEVVKSRIQTMNELVAKGSLKGSYKGVLDCLKTVASIEGPRSLWKGNSIGLARFFPNEKMNNMVKDYVRGRLPISCLSNVGAGVAGGWASAGVLFPIDTVRILLATSPQSQRQTLTDLAKKVKACGIRFLYNGYTSSLMGIAVFRGSYFGLYDSLKGYTDTTAEKWTVAYISGLCAGLAAHPVETLRKKKVVMENNLSSMALCKEIARREGVRGLYRGCVLIPFQSLVGAGILLYFDRKSESES